MRLDYKRRAITERGEGRSIIIPHMLRRSVSHVRATHGRINGVCMYSTWHILPSWPTWHHLGIPPIWRQNSELIQRHSWIAEHPMNSHGFVAIAVLRQQHAVQIICLSSSFCGRAEWYASWRDLDVVLGTLMSVSSENVPRIRN